MSMKILPINDSSDKHFKKHKKLFDLPMRLLLIGKSQLSGKTSTLINLIAREEMYKNYFDPENIFIVSPSIKTEKFRKFVQFMKIPHENLFPTYNENQLEVLYQTLKEEHEEEEKKEHKLIIFDDVAYTGKLSSAGKKDENIMDKLFCNSRHQLISVIVIAQKYTQLSTCLRENCTGIIMWECSNQQLEQLEAEHNAITTKKLFFKKFREATREPHSFFVINYKYSPELRYFSGFDTLIKWIDEVPEENKHEQLYNGQKN